MSRKKQRRNRGGHGDRDTVAAISGMLNTGGYTDETATAVRRYAIRFATERQRMVYKKVKKMFSEMVKAKLDDHDRMIMGKMISIMLRMNFTTGLKMGIMAQLFPQPGVQLDDYDKE